MNRTGSTRCIGRHQTTSDSQTLTRNQFIDDSRLKQLHTLSLAYVRCGN